MFTDSLPTEQLIPLVNIAQELSPVRAIKLGNFLSEQIKPPEWTTKRWDYLLSGQAEHIEVNDMLELRVAFGNPVLKALEMCDGELMAILELMFFLSIMDELSCSLFGDGDVSTL